jgi:hypothetical protein
MLLSSPKPGVLLITSETGSDGENGKVKRVTAERCRRISLGPPREDVRDEKREEKKTREAVERARSTGLRRDYDPWKRKRQPWPAASSHFSWSDNSNPDS